MRVCMMRGVARTPEGIAFPGDEADLPEKTALSLIAQGVAVCVAQDEVPEHDAEANGDITLAEDDLETLPRAALVERAKALGLSAGQRDSKAELIIAIRAAEAEYGL